MAASKPPTLYRDAMKQVHQYIDGRSQSIGSGQPFDSVNPATGQVIARVETAGSAGVDAAVAAAKAAQPGWAAMPAVERGRILARVAVLLRERVDSFAALEVSDNGKPITEAREVDIPTGADALEYFAGLAPAIQGSYQSLGATSFFHTRPEPLGVCAGIGAWNYPLQIACWKSAPALAAGNAMVFKPSEVTPLSVVALAELFSEAGLPDGVFNVVQGAAETGRALTAHPNVAKVSFTGESGTGRAIMADSAPTLKQVTLELGGKSPLLIFDDTPLDQAVAAAMTANFYTQGEVCTHGTRVFVQSGIHGAFLEQLETRTRALIVGDPTDPATQIGALVSREHLDKVLGYIASADAAGATRLFGGERVTDGNLGQGAFVRPAVYVDNTDDMAHVREEIFGPVMSVLRFEDETEAVRRANDTPFGLAAGVFTRDISRAHRVIDALHAGICWINTWGDSPVEMPVGGFGQSGLGRENGLVTLQSHTRSKSVFVSTADFEGAYPVPTPPA